MHSVVRCYVCIYILSISLSLSLYMYIYIYIYIYIHTGKGVDTVVAAAANTAKLTQCVAKRTAGAAAALVRASVATCCRDTGASSIASGQCQLLVALCDHEIQTHSQVSQVA